MDIITKCANSGLPFSVEKQEDGKGQIVSYISSFNNADVVGDIMKEGAFDKWIKQFEEIEGNKLPMLLQHSQTDIVGEWYKFEVDNIGLKAYGEIYDETNAGSDARKLVLRGLIGSTSIGFRSPDYEMLKEGGRLFKQVELTETSLVINPANPKAKIISVKTDEGKVDIRKVESLLRDAGLSRTESKTLLSKGQSGLRDVVSEENQKLALVNSLKGRI